MYTHRFTRLNRGTSHSAQKSGNRKTGIRCANRRKDHRRNRNVAPMIVLEFPVKFAGESIDYAQTAVLGLPLRGHSSVFNSTPDQRSAARGRNPNVCGRIYKRVSRCIRHEFGNNHPETPALLRIDLEFSLQQFELYPPKLQPREADRLAELTQVRTAIDGCAKFRNPQRAMNTREVFQPTLNCGEGALDFVVLRECGGPRNCPNSRREFPAYPVRQLLQQKSHRDVRISSPPIANHNWHARLHTGM
jgi:hypothetical protein